MEVSEFMGSQPEKEEEQQKEFSKSAIVKQAILVSMTLANEIIGAGMLALGEAFVSIGCIPAIVIMILSTVYVMWHFQAINEATYFVGAKTLRELLVYLFGSIFAFLADFCITLFLVSYLMSYLIISSQYTLGFIKAVYKEFDYDSQQCYASGIPCAKHLITVAIYTVIELALTIFKKMSFINYISVLTPVFSIATVIILLVILIMSATKKVSMTGNELDIPSFKMWPTNFKDFIKYVPFLVSLFGIQSSPPPIYHAIQHNNNIFKLKVMKMATVIAVLITGSVFLFMGIISSSLFKHPKGNVIQSFVADLIPITIIRFLMTIICIVSYPALMFPIRESIMRWFPHDENSKVHNILFYVVGIVTTLVCSLVALLYPNIGSIFSAAASLFGIFESWVAMLVLLLFMPKIRKLMPYDERKQEIGSEMTEAESEEDENARVVEEIECEDNKTEQDIDIETIEEIVNEGTTKQESSTKLFEKEQSRFKSKLPDIPLGKCRITFYSIFIVLTTAICLVSFVMGFI